MIFKSKTKLFRKQFYLLCIIVFVILFLFVFFTYKIVKTYKNKKSQLDILVDTLTMRQVYPSYFNHIKEF